MKPAISSESEQSESRRARLNAASFLTDEEAILWKRIVLAMCASPIPSNAALRADELVAEFRERANGLREFQSKQLHTSQFIGETEFRAEGERR